MTDTTERITSVQAEVAWRAQALVRILVHVDAYHDDIHGAVSDGQRWMAGLAARKLGAECCGVSSLRHGGSLRWTQEDVTFDPYTCADVAVLAAADRLGAAAAEYLVSGDGQAVRDAADGVVSQMHTDLDLGTVLPRLRDPGGMFEVIGLARGALDACEALGLPPVLPPSWTDPGKRDT